MIEIKDEFHCCLFDYCATNHLKDGAKFIGIGAKTVSEGPANVLH